MFAIRGAVQPCNLFFRHLRGDSRCSFEAQTIVIAKYQE